MIRLATILATAMTIGALAGPAAAQYPYPQPYPYPGQPYPGQPYPGQPYPGQTYPGQPYPGQPYGGNVIGNVIDQLLGNRYNVTDRRAVGQCANAALAQASNQYRGYNPYGGYGGGYGQQYAQNFNMRVVGITNVERRSSGLRVSGLIDSGTWYGQYGNQYWNQGNLNPRYGDLTFRCNVDYRGYVTNVRIRRNDSWRRPF